VARGPWAEGLGGAGAATEFLMLRVPREDVVSDGASLAPLSSSSSSSSSLSSSPPPPPPPPPPPATSSGSNSASATAATVAFGAALAKTTAARTVADTAAAAAAAAAAEAQGCDTGEDAAPRAERLRVEAEAVEAGAKSKATRGGSAASVEPAAGPAAGPAASQDSNAVSGAKSEPKLEAKAESKAASAAEVKGQRGAAESESRANPEKDNKKSGRSTVEPEADDAVAANADAAAAKVNRHRGSDAEYATEKEVLVAASGAVGRRRDEEGRNDRRISLEPARDTARDLAKGSARSATVELSKQLRELNRQVQMRGCSPLFVLDRRLRTRNKKRSAQAPARRVLHYFAIPMNSVTCC